jgi:hypothetical protein
MYGEGFTAGEEYKVIYWDGGGYKRVAEVDTPTDGSLSSQHTFDDPDEAGDWHCTVYYPSTYDPPSYSATDANIVADDTSYTGGYAFHVTESAIPEFPTAFVAIGVVGFCGVGYLWLRRRHRQGRSQN